MKSTKSSIISSVAFCSTVSLVSWSANSLNTNRTTANRIPTTAIKRIAGSFSPDFFYPGDCVPKRFDVPLGFIMTYPIYLYEIY